ncbi:MAG: hypothetical protein LBV04_08335 [Deferribacteraceae bacterium]|jgi:hypothetical protein|nr:hypothetical protein [Deferribacteraceae bacterium]
MRKCLVMFMIAFLLSLLVACGSGSGESSTGGGGSGSGGGGVGGGGGSVSGTVLSVSPISSTYRIEQLQRGGRAATMVGIRVNPPVTDGLHVSLTDDSQTLVLKPLGDNPDHDAKTNCVSCHDAIAIGDKYGAAYFTACNLIDTNTIFCENGMGDNATFYRADDVRIAVRHDDPTIEIVGDESLSAISFSLGEYDAPDGFEVEEVTMPGNLALATDPASALEMSLLIDASGYPENKYGQIGVVLDDNANTGLVGEPPIDGAGEVILQVTPASDLSKVVATTKCYTAGANLMYCQNANGSWSDAPLPIPLQSSNILIGTNADTRGAPTMNAGTPSNSSELNGSGGLLDTSITNDIGRIALSPISATLPLQKRNAQDVPVVVAKNIVIPTGASPKFTAFLGAVDVSSALSYNGSTLSLACRVTSADEITCNDKKISFTYPNSVTLTVNTDANPPTFYIPLKTTSPTDSLVVTEDSGNLPIVSGLESVLVAKSSNIRFVVKIANTAPNSQITCGLYEADENGLLTGLVSLVNDLLAGEATIEFAPQKPSNSAEQMEIPSTCTYKPGLLGVAASVSCTGATINSSTDLLSLLDNKQFVMLCAESVNGEVIATGKATPIRMAIGVLGALGL